LLLLLLLVQLYPRHSVIDARLRMAVLNLIRLLLLLLSHGRIHLTSSRREMLLVRIVLLMLLLHVMLLPLIHCGLGVNDVPLLVVLHTVRIDDHLPAARVAVVRRMHLGMARIHEHVRVLPVRSHHELILLEMLSSSGDGRILVGRRILLLIVRLGAGR